MIGMKWEILKRLHFHLLSFLVILQTPWRHDINTSHILGIFMCVYVLFLCNETPWYSYSALTKWKCMNENPVNLLALLCAIQKTLGMLESGNFTNFCSKWRLGCILRFELGQINYWTRALLISGGFSSDPKRLYKVRPVLRPGNIPMSCYIQASSKLKRQCS